MKMNHKILKTLEYDKIRQQIAEHTVTENGQRFVKRMVPQNDNDHIQKLLQETCDGVDVLRLKGGIPIPKLMDIQVLLKRLTMGATLNGKELSLIARVLRATNVIKSFFRELLDDDIDLRRLYDLNDQLETLPEVSKRLLVAIESDGHVTDDASSLLKSLRHQIECTEVEIRDRLSNLTHGSKAKYLSDSLVTIRNERYVIPVKAENRGQFGGVVHDQSSSGQTLFIEPQVVVDLNNRLKQQQSAEKEEIQRILRELSGMIAPYTNELAENSWILGQMDFINAKAQYAKQIKGALPEISTDNNVYLRQAWHPLLNPKTVVKNDILLGEDYHTIVITGPNTGGKTITLKTLGLIQLMGQSGLFIPAAEESRIGVFDEVFADIGDEQSIEQSLSTFSSHMTNIVEILKHITARSLVLFDELGAGTDPQEGAALAIAILDAVGTIGSDIVATTHYPELKAYGYERPQTINASMEFDSETLKPTYKLLIGIPGRSNAFDISQRLGLPMMIVQAARQLVTQDSQDLNEMIADLVQKRHDAEEKQALFKHHLKEAEKLHHDLENEFEKFERHKDGEIERAKQRANRIVNNAQREADQIISKLRKMRNQSTNVVKEKQLVDAKTKLNQLEQPVNLAKNRVLRRAKNKKAFHVNDDVLVKSYDQRGVLVRQIDDRHWEVQLGILKMKIDVDDLEKIKIDDQPATKTNVSVKRSASSGLSTQIDLRGQTKEEALMSVDRYIDSALLAGYSSVTIVHGKGTGALQQAIKQYLSTNSAVKGFHYAPPNAGGDGATIVEFK